MARPNGSKKDASSVLATVTNFKLIFEHPQRLWFHSILSYFEIVQARQKVELRQVDFRGLFGIHPRTLEERYSESIRKLNSEKAVHLIFEPDDHFVVNRVRVDPDLFRKARRVEHGDRIVLSVRASAAISNPDPYLVIDTDICNPRS